MYHFKSKPWARFLIRNYTLLAVPITLALFILIVWLCNPINQNLTFLIYPRLFQGLLTVGIIFGLTKLIDHLGQNYFQPAHDDLNQLEQAEFYVKRGKKILKKQSDAQLATLTKNLEDQLKGKRPFIDELHALLTYAEAKFSVQFKDGPWAIVLSLVLVLGSVLFLRSFVIAAYKIPSGSMLPSLQIGDQLFANRFLYGLRIPFTNIKLGTHIRPPQRGEIIIFDHENSENGESEDFIKRVIAIGGDVIDLRGDQVLINGNPLKREKLQRPCDQVDFDDKTKTWHAITSCEFYNETSADGKNTYLTMYTDHPAKTPEIRFPYTVPADSVFVMGDNRHNSHDSRYWGTVPLSIINGKALIIWWSEAEFAARLDRFLKIIR